jgi:histidinol-phosphate phosphatase family protein
MKKPNQAVILAGGLGSRIKPLSQISPKPMIEVNRYPFIYYLIKRLEKYNFSEAVILVGYKKEKFENLYFLCKNFKIKIKLVYCPPSFNTGARLKAAYPHLKNFFFLLYGDNYLPFNFHKIWKNYLDNKNENQLIAYKNSDNFSTSNIRLDSKNIVTDYDDSRTKGYDYVNIGFFILKKKYIENISNNIDSKFENEVLKKLIRKKKISAYITQHRYYSLTDINRFFVTNNFFRNRNDFVFLDRDGVLNIKPKKGEYVSNLKEFNWKPGSIEALKFLGKINKKIIIISNQAGISLNKTSLVDLNEIHEYIRSEAYKLGAIIQDIIFCPHHWDDDCSCRKPKSGMFYHAQKNFNIDLTNSIFVGDQKSDRMSAYNADIPYLHLGKNKSLFNLLKKYFKFK